MNYLKHYCNLIRKAEQRDYTKKKANKLGIYVEGHHVFPRCIFGQTKEGNRRVVFLTAREHYIAHALLEKIYIKRCGVNHWKSQKMCVAFWCMNVENSKNVYYNSYLYEKCRIRFVSSMTGRKMSEEQKRLMSESNKKRVWWTDGENTRHCEECPGDGWYRGRPNINVGRVISEETREKLRKRNTGKTLSKEQKEKLSKKISGRKWWNNGEIDKHCKECPGPEWKPGRLKESWCKGKRGIFSEETLEKMKIGRIKYRYTIKSFNGEIYISYNMSEFCRVHNLIFSNMQKVLYGKRNHHKGWSIVSVEKLSEEEKKNLTSVL